MFNRDIVNALGKLEVFIKRQAVAEERTATALEKILVLMEDESGDDPELIERLTSVKDKLEGITASKEPASPA